MSKSNKSLSGAAIAAGLLYVTKRRKGPDGKDGETRQLPPIPSGEDPQTD